jgi:hypothetical protein
VQRALYIAAPCDGPCRAVQAREAHNSSYDAFDAFVAAMKQPQTEAWWREHVALEQ